MEVFQELLIHTIAIEEENLCNVVSGVFGAVRYHASYIEFVKELLDSSSVARQILGNSHLAQLNMFDVLTSRSTHEQA